MKRWLRLSWLACAAVLAVPLLRADNIPDLFLHDGVSLDGEWKIIIDPYETGFYDYRYCQRDLNPNPSRAETFSLDVKPADPGAAWLPGTEGLGVTDVLFGDYKFIGKLPRIWPRSDTHIVSTDKSEKPLFLFGFGLTD
jgi:hypothetical protein